MIDERLLVLFWRSLLNQRFFIKIFSKKQKHNVFFLFFQKTTIRLGFRNIVYSKTNLL